MKKNKLLCTMATGAAVLSAISVVPALAAEEATPVTAVPISAELPADTAENTAIAAASQYNTVSGTVASITKEDNYTRIEITNDNMGMVFTAQDTAFVLNSEDGAFLSLSDIKEGDTLTGIIANNAPMTASLPPMTPGAIGFVLGEMNNVMTGVFDTDLTCQSAKLKLNIAEDTKIIDQTDSKKTFTAEDIKGQDCLVLYGATTRSIPAQTTPTLVMLLNDTEATETVDTTTDIEQTASNTPAETAEETVAPEPKAIELLPLRDAAEAAGFQITWTANDKPVLLEKDGVQIEITVGDTTYKKGDETLSSTKAPELKDSKIYVGSDITAQFS